LCRHIYKKFHRNDPIAGKAFKATFGEVTAIYNFRDIFQLLGFR